MCQVVYLEPIYTEGRDDESESDKDKSDTKAQGEERHEQFLTFMAASKTEGQIEYPKRLVENVTEDESLGSDDEELQQVYEKLYGWGKSYADGTEEERQRMAARKKAEAIRSGLVLTEYVQPTVLQHTIVEESARVVIAETEKDVERPITEDRLISEDRGEKRSAEDRDVSEKVPVDKRPCLEESAVVAPFIIEPKIKNMSISSEASALKNPGVALSLAAAVSLPADKVTFRAETDLATVALATQSALLTVGRIAELGRRQRDAVERIGRLQLEVDGQRSRAELEAMRAAMKSARAEAEKKRARTADQLRSDVEERANVSEESRKLAKEAVAKLEAELEGLKQAKEKAESDASVAFEAGKRAAFNDYNRFMEWLGHSSRLD
ncbi:uncharacterized protein LOC114266277 [Camellia sinensis]|uniref:uncharacterized protein LOC114266277 n=1 Tax=Camellia sinensis TaxID=4442 RepID=UPI0010368350|nr:uncharacterized protein LOC114266277 [Camellia sinensis]